MGEEKRAASLQTQGLLLNPGTRQKENGAGGQLSVWRVHSGHPASTITELTLGLRWHSKAVCSQLGSGRLSLDLGLTEASLPLLITVHHLWLLPPLGPSRRHQLWSCRAVENQPSHHESGSIGFWILVHFLSIFLLSRREWWLAMWERSEDATDASSMPVILRGLLRFSKTHKKLQAQNPSGVFFVFYFAFRSWLTSLSCQNLPGDC